MNKRIVICSGLYVAAMCLLPSPDASAVPIPNTAQFCTEWLTDYEDSTGEPESDWAWQDGTVHAYRHAQFTRTSLQVNIGGSWYSLGTHYMTEYDGNRYYCTPPVSYIPGYTHRFWVLTQLKYSNRKITIMGDSSTWANPGVSGYYWDFYIPASSDTLKIVRSPINPQHLSKQSNMGYVARQLMAQSSSLDFPNGAQILVNMDNSDVECACGGCDMGYVAPYWRTCIRSDDALIRRFTAGHELGHVIASMNYGVTNTANYLADSRYWSSNGWVESNSLWKPTAQNCKSDQKHIMSSREWIGAAQAEGFAHFISTALFNAREVNAGFKSYRPGIWVPTGNYNFDVIDYPWINLGDEHKYLKNYCNPGDQALGGYMGFGTEWDWSQFFWQLWAHGSSSQKWSVNEMNLAFGWTSVTKLSCSSENYCARNSSGEWQVGRLWEDLEDKVEDQWISFPTKVQRFKDLGAFTGVKYQD